MDNFLDLPNLPNFSHSKLSLFMVLVINDVHTIKLLVYKLIIQCFSRLPKHIISILLLQPAEHYPCTCTKFGEIVLEKLTMVCCMYVHIYECIHNANNGQILRSRPDFKVAFNDFLLAGMSLT